MILPARRKWVRKASNLHFFCPGEGCGARLAHGNSEVIDEDTGEYYIEVRLESRYTDDPHPSYPPGAWWRQRRGGYQGVPRARDARKAMRDIDEATEGVTAEAVQSVVKATVRNRQLLDNTLGPDYEEYATPEKWHEDVVRRAVFHAGPHALGVWRKFQQAEPALPPGTHIVVCYRCGGQTTIKTPIPGRLPLDEAL